MSKDEAKAWKIAIMYTELAKKYFPDYKHVKIGKGDPRKTNLFRHCYKLVRECDSLLEDYEYKLYITAQLQILKNIDLGENQALVSPNILVGTKAWKRWLVWKKRFNQNVKVSEEKPKTTSNKVFSDLQDTKKFLMSKFSELNKQSIIDSLKNRNIFRWCALGLVTPYYLALSPTVAEWIRETGTNLLESFTIDMSFYRGAVNEELQEYFKSEFPYDSSDS
jgi:hypothetical protein